MFISIIAPILGRGKQVQGVKWLTQSYPSSCSLWQGEACCLSSELGFQDAHSVQPFLCPPPSAPGRVLKSTSLNCLGVTCMLSLRMRPTFDLTVPL